MREGGSRWLLSAPIIALLVLGAAVAAAVPALAPFIGFVGLAVAIPVTVILFFVRSRGLPKREQTAWRYIAIGLSLFWAGVVTIGILTEMGVDPPAYGPLDGFFLAAYGAILIAVYRLARLDSGGREWVLTILDAAVGGIALAALVWSALFTDLMDTLEGAPWWEVAIAASYPILDVMVVVGLIIMIMRRSNYRFDPRLVLVAIGGGAQVLADLIYLSNSVGEQFATAEPAYALNLLAVALMLTAATIVDRSARRREFPEAPTPIWVLMWPYVIAGVLLVVHFKNYRDLVPGSNEILLLDAVILIGVVILFRQVYVIYRDRNRVDRKRAELVASVSHELRTPLTAMVGFLTLLDEHADEFPADARKEMLSEAAIQARHMSRLVSDLLVLARGDTSLMSMERKDVPAMSIVLSVLRGTDTGNIRIEEDLDASVQVHVDPDRMKQALANLLNNSIRYGGDRCLVVARVVGRDLVFEVHDNGEGVPTRFEAAIWQQFERGAHRLDAVTPGLGIGLSIVQAIMEAHGGIAEYRQSERLGGACFSLTIPGSVLEMEKADRRVPVGH
jgi:signal transduction histidine kinase